MDETNDTLELLRRGGYRISITRPLCASLNEKWYYRKYNEYTYYHLDLFHDNMHKIIEYYPIHIMSSKSNL